MDIKYKNYLTEYKLGRCEDQGKNIIKNEP